MSTFPQPWLISPIDSIYPPLLQYPNILHVFSLTPQGVTLLAFGNGAPDVFASVLAAKKLQITLSLSSLVGSSLFITTVVAAVILFISGKSKVDTTKFLRDAGTLLLTVVIIMIYGLLGRVQVFQASVLLLLYVVYVVSVIYSEKDQEFVSIERLDTPVSSVIFIEVPKVIVDSLNKSQMDVKELKSGNQDFSFVETIQWSFLKFQYFWEKS